MYVESVHLAIGDLTSIQFVLECYRNQICTCSPICCGLFYFSAYLRYHLWCFDRHIEPSPPTCHAMQMQNCNRHSAHSMPIALSFGVCMHNNMCLYVLGHSAFIRAKPHGCHALLPPLHRSRCRRRRRQKCVAFMHYVHMQDRRFSMLSSIK